jgi:hypothetical protein
MLLHRRIQLLLDIADHAQGGLAALLAQWDLPQGCFPQPNPTIVYRSQPITNPQVEYRTESLTADKKAGINVMAPRLNGAQKAPSVVPR